MIGPPTVANTVHQWFWKGLGATVSTITAALFVRGVVLRRMRRTLLAPGQVSR